MKLLHRTGTVFLLLLLCLGAAGTSNAQDSEEAQEAPALTLSANADIVSRYVWRGMSCGDAASIQPLLELTYKGFDGGFWGSYSADYEEVDIWLSYTVTLPNSISLTATLTDFYYPSAGLKYFNYHNYDDPDGPGAHTVELGLSLAGPSQFPLTLGGYYNAHNDAGKNAYFEAAYSTAVDHTTLDFWVGAAAGSTENPDYYGTDDLEVINVGVKGTRSLKLWQETEVPLSVSFTLNPNMEITYLVLGITL